MKKLDLHGIPHSEVKILVQDWVITEYNKGNTSVQIITGNSEKMKSIVAESLDEINFEYRIGDFLGNNQGYIQIL